MYNYITRARPKRDVRSAFEWMMMRMTGEYNINECGVR